MGVEWSYAAGVVIVACACIALVLGRLEPKDFITCVGIVVSFWAGRAVGVVERLAKRMGEGR